MLNQCKKNLTSILGGSIYNLFNQNSKHGLLVTLIINMKEISEKHKTNVGH